MKMMLVQIYIKVLKHEITISTLTLKNLAHTLVGVKMNMIPELDKLNQI